MLKIIVVLALVKSGFCGIFDFSEFDDPYSSNFFFNRPAEVFRQHHGRCRATQDGRNQEGVCLTRPECTFGGGRPLGQQSCLLGTCCVYTRGCNQVSSKRISYFEGTTQRDNSVCSYTVRVENNNICQMRLDFDSLNLPNPRRFETPGDTPGTIIERGPYTCKDAFFQVESPNNNGRIPTLCGNNNGQHIYVPVNASRGERDLVIKIVNNFATSGDNNANSVSWKIKITQLECPTLTKHQKPLRIWEDSFLIAPAGCLQYHLNPSGTIRNLGYDTGRTLVNNHYEALFNYAVCFRRTPDMCGIDYTVNQFSLGSLYDPAATPPVQCTAVIPGSNLMQDTDFLFVPNGLFTGIVDDGAGGTTNVIVNRDRYCGELSANSKIRSVTPGPFYIFFKTDNMVLGLDNTPVPSDPPADPVVPDPENGWELTYNTLYGSNCGTLS